MNDFFDNFKNDLGEIGKKVKIGYAKLVGKKVSADGRILSNKPSSNSYEINLVPEVKAQMIRAQKIRNIVLFACILVASISAGVVVVLFGVKSGQDIAMANQDRRMGRMSAKLTGYNELEDLVTFQSQLSAIQAIANQKTELSRVFGAVGVMLMQGADDVKLSELRVNLETSIVTMEGQADAKVAPLIDYRVLEAFKKSVELTKYDYGRYVDIDGKEIPTQCITESDAEGNALRQGDSYYAWWDLTIDGCAAAPRDLSQENAALDFHYSKDLGEDDIEEGEVKRSVYRTQGDCTNPLDSSTCKVVYRYSDDRTVVPEDVEVVTEATEGENATTTTYVVSVQPTRVRIWRTPQFDKWYEAGQMSLDGAVTGIEHFDTVCYKYKGTLIDGKPRWSSTNDCLLAEDGLRITSSSNGRDDSNNLVLRFTASVEFAEDFFAFKNKHMIAIGPMGQNVTDSYVQVGNMFTQEARECEEGDTECLSASNNTKSEGE